MRIKGINKYGIKLEDHADYDSYKRAMKNAAVKAHHKTPKGLLTLNKAISKYRKTDQGKASYKSVNVKYQTSKLNRIPKWVDLKAIKQFYYNCPENYEVDHIVPLKGINVSGLHVLNNLQYLTKSNNLKKGNTWICSS